MSSARLLLLGMIVVGIVAVIAFSWISDRFEHVAAGAIPLAPRDFGRLTLITAGTGGTFENHQRLGPAVVALLGREALLVDAGRGVAEALRKSEIPVSQPSLVLLTSLLPENTVGLDDLVLTRALAIEPGLLRIAGPSGTRALVEGLLAAHAAGGARSGLAELSQVEATDVADGETLRLGEALAAHATAMPGGPFPALAWRIQDSSGRAALVSSVGFAPDALVEAGRGARLWVHDALYGAALDAALAEGALRPDVLRAEAAVHTRLEQVGELASRMGVGAVALVRLRPPPVFDFQYTRIVGEHFRGRVVIASDGTELTP